MKSRLTLIWLCAATGYAVQNLNAAGYSGMLFYDHTGNTGAAGGNGTIRIGAPGVQSSFYVAGALQPVFSPARQAGSGLSTDHGQPGVLPPGHVCDRIGL